MLFIQRKPPTAISLAALIIQGILPLLVFLVKIAFKGPLNLPKSESLVFERQLRIVINKVRDV